MLNSWLWKRHSLTRLFLVNYDDMCWWADYLAAQVRNGEPRLRPYPTDDDKLYTEDNWRQTFRQIPSIWR